MKQILISPMSIVSITTYHTKNLPTNTGLSYGIIYAQQEELTYKISMVSPIASSPIDAKKIIQRIIQYESLRLRKANNNTNYYDEFVLIGWYCAGPSKFFDLKLKNQISEALNARGAPFLLLYDFSKEPVLQKDGKVIKYSYIMSPLEKYCIDSLQMQKNTKESPLIKTLNKQKHLIEIYNQKLKKLETALKQAKVQQKKQKILEALNMYERIVQEGKQQKLKTIEAINYSVLNGLIITHQSDYI